MTSLGRNFWIGVFWGFTFFVVVSVGVVLIRQMSSKKPLLINRKMEELLRLQRIPPTATLSIYDEASDWNLQALAGQKVVLADFKGKVIFLNFWATWCGPCVAEMPAIQR